jgi:hypothetical protein
MEKSLEQTETISLFNYQTATENLNLGPMFFAVWLALLFIVSVTLRW